MTAQGELWHLSTGYSETATTYCRLPHRQGIDFRTFNTEQVTCGDCYLAAVKAWGKKKADAYVWGIG